MPKIPVEKMRVPLNVLVARSTKESITSLQNKTRESQGEIVDRAVALLCDGEIVPVPRTKKESRKARAARERAEADVTAQVTGHAENIDYSDVDSTPTTNVASLDAVGVPLRGTIGKASSETWRRPIREKGDSKR